MQPLRVIPAGQGRLQAQGWPRLPQLCPAAGSRRQESKLPPVQGNPDGFLRYRESQPAMGKIAKQARAFGVYLMGNDNFGLDKHMEREEIGCVLRQSCAD